MKQIHHLSGIFQISGIANLQHWILFGLVDALLMFLGKKRSNFSFFQNKTSAVVACLKITCHLSQKKGPSNFVFSTALQYFQLNLTETFWYKNILLRLDEMHLVDSHWLVLNKRIFTTVFWFFMIGIIHLVHTQNFQKLTFLPPEMQIYVFYRG